MRRGGRGRACAGEGREGASVGAAGPEKSGRDLRGVLRVDGRPDVWAGSRACARARARLWDVINIETQVGLCGGENGRALAGRRQKRGQHGGRRLHVDD